ncbi:MAG: glycosyltransferase family 39 protein [Anaerolineae bacterium]|nr:glycosyltransferase family 39 protein [Anaerolineae bacterium]
MILIAPGDLLQALWGLAFAAPWAWWLLPPRRRAGIALALLTLALSLGALTLWMLALTLAGALSLGAVRVGTLAVFGAGMAACWRAGARLARPRRKAGGIGGVIRRHPLAAGTLAVLVGLAALVVFNALYWPFYAPDAVSIYADQSRIIYQVRALPGGEGLYEAYPMLLPLSHAYAYLAAGALNEYAAKVAVAALALGALGATYALGRALYGWRVGLGAAALLALTPEFARWAPAGYTDIPAGFFAALAALAAWWLAEDRSLRAAWLLGALAGLAAWTKNSALAFVLSAGLWLVYARWRGWIGWRHGLALAGGLALTAGPWYARNLLEFGRLVPPTVWSEQARHTVGMFAPFLGELSAYSAPGLIVTAGMASSAVEALRGVRPFADRARLLWLMAGPFAAAWWWVASYETRFLQAIYPLLCVMGARALLGAWDALRRERASFQPAIQAGLLALVLLLALPAARKALDFKAELIRAPLMSDEERHRVALGPLYDLARYLRALPAAGTALSDNNLLPFLAAEEGRLRVIVGGLPDRAALARYDYLVVRTESPLLRVAQPGDVTPLATFGPYTAYRVHHR